MADASPKQPVHFPVSRKRHTTMPGFLTAETIDPTLERELRERKARRLTHSHVDVSPMAVPFRSDLEEDVPPRPNPMNACSKADHISESTVNIENPSENTDFLLSGSPTSNANETVRHAHCSPANISVSCIGEEISHITEVDGIRIVLDDMDLWQTFYRCGTEMIINRPGRRMFPSVVASVSGLSPSAYYSVQMEVVPADDRRYKYVNNKWMAVGKADPEIRNPPYVHPDSPSTGKFWMQTKVSFSKIKITNNKDSEEGNILIHSMHKYMARVTITRMRNAPEDEQPCYVFPLPLTAFIAVTAYQSESITQMKIRNNPFAKAFRESDIAGIMHHRVDGCMPRYLPATECEQASSHPRKAQNTRHHLEASRIPGALGRSEVFHSLDASPTDIRMNYPPSFGVLPHANMFSSADILGYHGNSSRMLLVPPPIGHQDLTSLERNEVTYRWLCACSQNLAAQMQMFQTRASSMMGHVTSTRSPAYSWVEQRSKSPANQQEMTKCLQDDGQSNSD